MLCTVSKHERNRIQETANKVPPRWNSNRLTTRSAHPGASDQSIIPVDFNRLSRMTQAIFFEQHETVETLPEGMRYREQLIAPAEEKALIARVRELPFKEFEFHGYKGKRRTVSFGWQYEFAGRGALKKANDIPEFIQSPAPREFILPTE